MKRIELLWNLFVHTGKIEYYMEYKKEKEKDIGE